MLLEKICERKFATDAQAALVLARYFLLRLVEAVCPAKCQVDQEEAGIHVTAGRLAGTSFAEAFSARTRGLLPDFPGCPRRPRLGRTRPRPRPRRCLAWGSRARRW